MTPDQHTKQELYLDVGDGHRIYVQDWGNADTKIPIVFLHGGPGTGCKDSHKNMFNPQTQRVIFHDQRGAGKSLPYGSIDNNTTQHLVEDIEKLANHMKLKQIIIVGGSWGSCLALAYAIKYPTRIRAMVLSGVITNSKQELEWFTKGLFKTFFPEVWEKYLKETPKSHHAEPSTYHFQRILGDDKQAMLESAKAFMDMDLAIMSLDDRYQSKVDEDFDGTKQKIEAHYFSNSCFMPDNYIFHEAPQIKAQVYLINGRYDMVCPPQNTYALHKLLPKSKIIWTISGHRDGHETWNMIRTIAQELSERG